MTKLLITAVASLILTALIGYLILPVLRALKAGQSIREVGPTWHNYKARYLLATYHHQLCGARCGYPYDPEGV